MAEMKGWKAFFNSYAPKYMEESFTNNTVQEVDFLEEELKLHRGASILDVGCGTGRHSLELSRRGYQVTGLDISENMLQEAKGISEREGLQVEFFQADAVDFTVDILFDACISLCEGAFGLLSVGEDPLSRDLKIIERINLALKPGSKFIMTVLNGMRMIRKYSEEDVERGFFDPVSTVEAYPLSEIMDGASSNIMVREKGFMPSELYLMLEGKGFKVEKLWGGTAGDWNRERVRLDEMEIMVVSRKKDNIE